MGKRPREPELSEQQGSRKAPKRQDPSHLPSPVQIWTVKDLQNLLRFDQTNGDALRDAQVNFKTYLDSAAAVESKFKAEDLDIIKQYLQKEPTDLLQTWSFAAQTDNDKLVTAVTSNIALLLRTLSTRLDLIPIGVITAKSILRREYLKLLFKGLSAESHKDKLISPCLRILTEIVSFDGGVLAAHVLREKDVTFNTRWLDRNLRLYRQEGKVEDRRNSSVRSNTIRYVVAVLRFSSSTDRIVVLELRSVFRNIFDNLKHDPEPVYTDILKVIETNVLRNADIPRKSKSDILSDRALLGFLEIARRYHRQDEDDAIADAARFDPWNYLDRLVTESSLGILQASSWYPVTNEIPDADLGDSGRSSSQTNTRNPILAKFLHHLKPQTQLQERQLMLVILGSAPDLVATFIVQAAARFQLAPKLTATWMSYISILYSIIDLPVPEYFGSKNTFRPHPPPTDIVLENLIPAPLTADITAKCLNQPTTLIRFVGVRIIVAALKKAEAVLRMYKTAGQRHNAYLAETSVLRARLVDRLPQLKDLVNGYRLTHENDALTKDAIARALVLYRRVLPPELMDDAADYATPLAALLVQLEDKDLTLDNRILLQCHLTHILELAEDSIDSRWWQRQASLAFSPFVTIIKLYVAAETSSAVRTDLRVLVSHIIGQAGFLQTSTKLSAVDALLASLDEGSGWKPTSEVWTFLDDCVARFVKRQIKYGDDLEILAETSGSDQPQSSLLLMVIVEQSPFLDRMVAERREPVLTWISRFLQAVGDIGEDEQIVQMSRSSVESHFKLPPQKVRLIEPVHSTASSDTIMETTEQVINGAASHHQPLFTPIPAESDKHPALIRYKKLDLDDLVHSPTLPELMLCLGSSYPEIRLQAITALEDIRSRLTTTAATIAPETSNSSTSHDTTAASTAVDAQDQLWLLLGELVETARSTIAARPLPHTATCFATAALKVVLDPAHFFYGAVARYLIKDPYWNVRKLPAYFLRRTLLEEEPDEEDRYWDQVGWVLGFLLDGLRTPQDAKLLCHAAAGSSSTVELILSLLADVHVTASVANAVVQLVQRVVAVDGPRTLALSAGLVAWVEQALRRAAVDPKLPRAMLAALREELVAGLKDDVRFGEWSHGFDLGKTAARGQTTVVAAQEMAAA